MLGRDRPGDEGVSEEEISIGEFARRSRLSLKVLRLYDERGVLVPSRVDQASGYRYYDTAQLDDARLVVMLRQLQLPLAAVKEAACDPAMRRRASLSTGATPRRRTTRGASSPTTSSADCAERGPSCTKSLPGRYRAEPACLKREVSEQGQWAFGKEFIGIWRKRPLPSWKAGRRVLLHLVEPPER